MEREVAVGSVKITRYTQLIENASFEHFVIGLVYRHNASVISAQSVYNHRGLRVVLQAA